MTVDLKLIISELKTEISHLEASPNETTAVSVSSKLQKLCQQLSLSQGQLGEEKQTIDNLKAQIETPGVKGLPQNTEITWLFQTALYLDSHRLDPSQALIEKVRSYHLPLKTIPPKPLKSNALNKEEAEKWISIHPKECQAAMRASLKALSHISQNKLEKALKLTVADFNRLIKAQKNTDYIALVWPHKSQEWMLELALPYLDILPKEILSFGGVEEDQDAPLKAEKEDIPDLDWFLKQKMPLEKIVIFDDGIYSGYQMFGIISLISDTCVNLGLPKPEFFIVCPFVSRKGISTIKELEQAFIKIHFCKAQEIPSFQKQILKQPEGEKLWSDLLAMGLETYNNTEGIGAMWRDGKIPDGNSFPYFIKEGIVTNKEGALLTKADEDGNLQIVRFNLMEETEPPYKRF